MTTLTPGAGTVTFNPAGTDLRPCPGRALPARLVAETPEETEAMQKTVRDVMTAVTDVPRQARSVAPEWRRLAAASASPAAFDPVMITKLSRRGAAVAGPCDTAGDAAVADRRAVHARADQAREVAAVHRGFRGGRPGKGGALPFTGVFAVDARVRVAPCQPQDPFLRRLR
jgi:hypothetical protein